MYIALEDHIKELKYRTYHIIISLLFNFVCLYALREELLFALTYRLDRGLIFTSLSESFMSQVEMAAFFALLITIPYAAFQIWAFVRPGLHSFEVQSIRYLMRFSLICYIASFFISYFIILPMAVEFLTTFEYIGSSPLHLEYYPRIQSFLSFVYKVIISTIVLFQAPLIALILYRQNLIHAQVMIRYRRYFLFLSFLLAAVCSPPDIGSQLVLAIPMIIFYEAIILYFLFREQVFQNKNQKNF